MRAVSIEFPEMVVELYGEEELKSSVRRWSVLDLVKKGKLSSGKASEILGITRWDFMELMSDYDIPMANFPPEELESQVRIRAFGYRVNNNCLRCSSFFRYAGMDMNISPPKPMTATSVISCLIFTLTFRAFHNETSYNIIVPTTQTTQT